MDNLKITEANTLKNKSSMKIDIIKQNFNRVFSYRLSSKVISIFCRQMYFLLSSGVTISQAFVTIAEGTRNKIFKRELYNISARIEQGNSASFSMSESINLFPEFLINMVSVGEKSGELDNIFKELCDYYIKEHTILKKIKSSMSYPTLLFILSVLIMTFLMIKIIPCFTSTLTAVGGEIPTITKITIGISNFLVENFFTIIILNVLLILLGFILSRKSKVREFLDNIKIRIPYISKIYLQFFQLKFMRSISILTSSGISLIYSFETAKNFTKNKEIIKRMNSCLNQIKDGNSIMSCMNNTKIFDNTIISLIKVGEATGSVSEMFIRSADILDEEIYSEIDKLTTLIEPIMIIIMSIMVCLVILSVIIPMMKINSSIGA